jgi:phospholipid transport system transporter-binding protein
MTFSLPQKVTQENALLLEKEGSLNLANLRVINCSSLKDFDSSVLTVLLGWQKRLQADGQSLSVEHAPEKLKVLASLYGVSALLGL